jgi:hypothetical protein
VVLTIGLVKETGTNTEVLTTELVVLVSGVFASPVVRTCVSPRFFYQPYSQNLRTPETNTEVLTTWLVKKNRRLTLRF